MAVPADLNTIHTPSTGGVAPAAWGLHIRTWLEFLADPPSCSAKGVGNQSVANNTVTALNAGAEDFDNDAMHSTVTNTSRITAQTPGRYMFMCMIVFAANNVGQRSADFFKNGTTSFGLMLMDTSGASSPAITGLRLVTMVAGDYMECRALQSSGAALDVQLLEFGALFQTR